MKMAFTDRRIEKPLKTKAYKDSKRRTARIYGKI